LTTSSSAATMITQHQHEGVTNPIFECWLVSWSGNHNADDVNYQERWLYTHGRTGIGTNGIRRPSWR
jgi:hypothetical protein